MPRARHDATGQLPFAQRAALVWTDAVQSVELAVNIEQGDDPISRDEFAGVAGRAFFDRRDSNPVRHDAWGKNGVTSF